MNDPQTYFFVRESNEQLNSLFVPKLCHAMSWDFQNGSILDYGCGPGNVGFRYMLPKAEQTNSKLYSVDISSAMVDYARNNFAHSRITYEVGNLPHDAPFLKKVDRAFAVHVLHLIRDVRPILKGIESILKPGGQFGFTTTTLNNPLFKTFEYLVDSPRWNPYMEGLKELIPEWSRVPEEIHPADFYRNYFVNESNLKEVFFLYSRPIMEMTMDRYLDFSMSLNPCVEKVPNNLLAELRGDYRRLITEGLQIPIESEKILLPLDYICMVLQK